MLEEVDQPTIGGDLVATDTSNVFDAEGSNNPVQEGRVCTPCTAGAGGI